MKYIKTKQFNFIILILIIGMLLSSLFYVMYFYNALEGNISDNVNYFTRIVIPDTFLYKNIVDVDNIIISLMFSDIKNTFGPSIVWYLSSLNWYVISLFNILIIILIIKYLSLLSDYFNLNNSHKQIIIVSFIIMPSTLYYSIGSLKELPMAFLLLAVIYHFLKRQNFKIFFFLFLLILYRYQMFVLIPMLYFQLFFKKNIFKKYILLLLILMAIYPIISNLTIFYNSTTELYREHFNSTSSIGAVVEMIRSDFPILSIFAIFFRVLQSLFEPIIVFLGTLSLYENEYFSIINFQYLISNIIIFPFIIIFFKKCLFIFKKGRLINRQYQIVFSVVFLLIVLIGGFSFIHHRYLYPLFPILMLLSLIPKEDLLINFKGK